MQPDRGQTAPGAFIGRYTEDELATATKPVVSFEIIRALTAEDVGEIAPSRPRPSVIPTVSVLRASHHKIAQLLAQGIAPTDVSLMTGTSMKMLRQLERDPAFCGLLQHYVNITEMKFADIIDRMKTIGQDALDILHERLLDKPELFSNGQLLEIADTLITKPLTAGRGGGMGAGGGASPVAVTINFKSPGRTPDVDCIEVGEDGE